MSDAQQETRSRELAAIAPEVGSRVMAFVPRTPEEIKWTIGMVVGAGLAPNSYGNDQKKMAIGIMKGMEVGLPPITALEWIAVINGRPTLWGDGAISLVHASGHLAGYEEIEIGTKPGDGDELEGFADDYGFEVRMTRKGVEGPFVGRFTVGDAKRAKLWMNPKRDPWMKYPRRMLRMRAVGFAIRNGFADCLAGMVIREEVEDLPAPPPERQDTSFLDGPAPELEHEAAPQAPAESQDGDIEETAAPAPTEPETPVTESDSAPQPSKLETILEALNRAEDTGAIDVLVTKVYADDIAALDGSDQATVEGHVAWRKGEIAKQAERQLT